VGYPPFLLSNKISTSQLLPLLTSRLLVPEFNHVIDKSSKAKTTQANIEVSITNYFFYCFCGWFLCLRDVLWYCTRNQRLLRVVSIRNKKFPSYLNFLKSCFSMPTAVYKRHTKSVEYPVSQRLIILHFTRHLKTICKISTQRCLLIIQVKQFENWRHASLKY